MIWGSTLHFLLNDRVEKNRLQSIIMFYGSKMVALKPNMFLEKSGEVSSIHCPPPANTVAPGFILSLVVPDGKGIFSSV